MSARDWQPGDEALLRVRFEYRAGDGAAVSYVGFGMGDRRTTVMVEAADLLPVPEPDEGAIERAAGVVAHHSGYRERDDHSFECNGCGFELYSPSTGIWGGHYTTSGTSVLDRARSLHIAHELANLLASPVQPGPTLHELVDETYEAEGVGIWWTNWAAADPAKRRSMEASVGYHNARQPGRSEAETVSTIEELDALPEGSVIRELDTGPWLGIQTVPGVFEKFPNGFGWFVVAGHGERPVSEIALPAVVLHRAARVAGTTEAGDE